jgi:opacity protein-like surface antigen
MGNYIKDYYNNYNSGSLQDEKVVNYNHVGGKFEYMINDIVGMGVDYTYAKVVYTYTDSYYVNGQSLPKYDMFTESLTKQRFLLRVNIHFATTRELDPYATAGFGYKQTVFKTNNPNNYNYDMSFFNAFPVAFMLGAGLRWFFTDNIGVCVEAGIGGPAVQGGLCAKF